MRVTLRTWAKSHQSISVDRGPLTYSLEIGEKYVRTGGTDRWPAFEIHPTTPWNYGLALNRVTPAEPFRLVDRKPPPDANPFTHEGTPFALQTKGKRIPEWKSDKLGLVGLLQDSPVKSVEPVEDLILIPMGAARLRITAFPVIGNGPEAHRWVMPLP
jgi:hypothetical protein